MRSWRFLWIIFVVGGPATTSHALQQKPLDVLEESLMQSEPVEDVELPAETEAKKPPAPPPLPEDAGKISEEPTPIYNVALLRGLNKVTAKIFEFEAETANSVEFENLRLQLYQCWKSKPEDQPENAALIQITDKKSEAKTAIFSGWMFSSSPGLSGLEHPVYDVTLLECKVKKEIRKP